MLSLGSLALFGSVARGEDLGSDLFESQGLDTFRDMQDQKISQTMADHAPHGIGKALVAFLAKAQAADAAETEGSTP